MAEQVTTIHIILDKLMRNPLLQDLTLETVVDYTVDFMRLVGTPAIFTEKVEVIQIKDFRGQLPCDYHKMIQMRINDCNDYVFRYSTDSFHMSRNKRDYNDLTYKIQRNIIFTNIEEAEVEIAYEAIATDEDGYPLIPDNTSFTRALELYIKKECYTILFETGKINEKVYSNTLQTYAWAVGDCQSEFNRMSLDKAESFYNSYHTLLMRSTQHSTGFRNNGTKELIKAHNYD